MKSEWIKAALVRAIKTVAQTAIATIGTSMVITDVDWRIVASASALAGILSILTSIAGLPEVDSDYFDDEEISNEDDDPAPDEVLDDEA